MFEIVKNLPIPVKEKNFSGWKRANKYPFGEMEIGDCLAFKANGPKDPTYKKIYGSAMSYARRVKKGYRFVFDKIEEGKYGCWKVSVHTDNVTPEPVIKNKSRKSRRSTFHITKEMLISALENDGTLVGASRILNISSRTISRLKQKFGI